jgi:Protein of unknown function (DUF3822)
LKQLFHIENPGDANAQQILSLRLGEKHISFSITNKIATELYQLAYCTADEWNENELAEFLTAYSVLKNNFYQVLVSYDYPQSVLVPLKEYRFEDGSLLVSSLYGNATAVVTIAESVAEWQLYNVYGVPTEIQDWVTKTFPAAKCRHQYSLAIKNSMATENGSLFIDFKKEDFTVIAMRQGKFLLAQTYEYATPEDVLYYLLRITSQFSLSQDEVSINLSGLIDKESSLYKELYQYYVHIEFRDAAWTHNEHPDHFFTSLNDLARCVS